MRILLGLLTAAALSSPAMAVVDSTTQHDTATTGLDGQIAVGDAISGLIATELAGDNGFHGAVTDPLDKLPAFTDDAGIRGTGLTGLMNDFPAVGTPTKRIQYDLAGPTSIGSIQVLTGNNGGDGRIFSTFTVYTSSNNGGTFDFLGYFESDPLGTLNNDSSDPRYRSTLVKVFDNASPYLATGATNLQFEFFAVDNTGGQYRDPFDGVNPYTGIDDNLSAAFVSPLLFEIDVIAIPEPATAGLLACGVAMALAARRRRK